MISTKTNSDQRIDAYINASEEFAQPILSHLRALVHKGCPGVKETMKWSFPHFEYNGSILCSMASFKQHCAFSFWKASLMKDEKKLFSAVEEKAMGQFGRIRGMDDLPSDTILIAYVKEAAKLNEDGVKVEKAKPKPKKEMIVPEDVMKALKKNKAALQTFEAFSPSHRREYIEWITEAKTEATRVKRLTTAIEWLTEGKDRNWKYGRK